VFSLAWGSKQNMLVAGGNSVLHIFCVDVADVLRIKHAATTEQGVAVTSAGDSVAAVTGVAGPLLLADGPATHVCMCVPAGHADAPQVLRRVCPAFKGWKPHQQQRAGSHVASAPSSTAAAAAAAADSQVPSFSKQVSSVP
jgi:hypothetical protein